MTINTTAAAVGMDVDMAIYFITDQGRMEQRGHTCLFCEQTFADRKDLNAHYFDEHSVAFSSEELVKAAARRAQVMADRASLDR